METIPLEMDDIFDEMDEDVPTRLPDLEDLDLEGGLEPMVDTRYDERNEQGEDEQAITDNPELLAKLKSLKGASKVLTKRTFIKLDATRLTGERGLPILPKIFNDVKLKGKNHEVEDLKTIMHHLEHWGHRLFPKMSFNEVLERAERLGAKKEVQTCVKRIRLGMPVLPTDAADEDGVQREGDDDVQREEDDDVQREENDGVQRGDSVITNLNQLPDEDELAEMNLVASQEEEEAHRESESIPKSCEAPVKNSLSVLSDEAKERIERNKKLAMERRAARLAAKANNGSLVEATVTSGPAENVPRSTLPTTTEEMGRVSNDEQNCLKNNSKENEKEAETEMMIDEQISEETEKMSTFEQICSQDTLLEDTSKMKSYQCQDASENEIVNTSVERNDNDHNNEAYTQILNEQNSAKEIDKDKNNENELDGNIENNQKCLLEESSECSQEKEIETQIHTDEDGENELNDNNAKDTNTENPSLIQEVNENSKEQFDETETEMQVVEMQNVEGGSIECEKEIGDGDQISGKEESEKDTEA